MKADNYGRTLIRNFEKAVHAYAFMGAQHPDDWPFIEEEYKQAKAALHKYVDRLKNESSN